VPLAILAIGVPLAGCDGGGNDRATVAASLDSARVAAALRHYFSTFNPEDSIFPYGAGPPRVKDNGCKHQRSADIPLVRPYNPKTGDAEKVVFWQCSVRFEAFTVPVAVTMNESGEVVWASPVYGDSRNAPPLSPARTYTG
jgi:hypothetical protein